MVLDPFCGSGTTAIAAMELGRNCATMDVNPDAITIAQQTITEASTKPTNALADAYINFSQTNHMRRLLDQQQIEEYSMEQFYAQRDELFALIEECEELEGEIQKSLT